MLTLIKIALRNILRNKRRSAMTIGAIAVGAVAMLVFASYLGFVVLGYRTGVVETVGHLAVYKNGYFEVGSGNPGGYGIADYDATMKLIHDDPVVGPTIEVLTPTVTLYGLASNSAIDTSKTFLGVGIVPSDHERMIRWNEYHLHGGPPRAMTAMSDADPTRGVVGTGLARILGLCQPLQVADCVDPPNAPHNSPMRPAPTACPRSTCWPPPRAARPASSISPSPRLKDRASRSSTTPSWPCTSRWRSSFSTARASPR